MKTSTKSVDSRKGPTIIVQEVCGLIKFLRVSQVHALLLQFDLNVASKKKCLLCHAPSCTQLFVRHVTGTYWEMKWRVSEGGVPELFGLHDGCLVVPVASLS